MAKIDKTVRAPRPASRKSLPRWKPLDWEDYSVGTGWDTNRATLERAVRRAAKAANQRLRVLEAQGRTKGAYKLAMRNLGERTRFKERTKTLSDKELRAEYARLREFISAKTSTPSGIAEADLKRFTKAQESGFSGTLEEWIDYSEQFFAARIEELFSSDVIYQAIVNGTLDIIAQMVEEYNQTLDAKIRQAIQKSGGTLSSAEARAQVIANDKGGLLKSYLARVEAKGG